MTLRDLKRARAMEENSVAVFVVPTVERYQNLHAVACCWNLVRLPRAPPSDRLRPRVRWARRSST